MTSNRFYSKGVYLLFIRSLKRRLKRATPPPRPLSLSSLHKTQQASKQAKKKQDLPLHNPLPRQKLTDHEMRAILIVPIAQMTRNRPDQTDVVDVKDAPTQTMH